MTRVKKLFCCIFLSVSVCVLPMKSKNVLAEEVKGAKAECVMELNSGRILYEQCGEKPMPMASTTKILTAITVLEKVKDLQTCFEIPQSAVGIEGSSIYLKSGEEYSAEELLYGLMLRSGNDAAVALAIRAFGSVERCLVAMNMTAQKAGALNSSFLSPHGLPQEGHYSTARDMCLITRYALQNAIFAKIVSTPYYSPRGWKNKNKMLYTYEGAIGVKTGYTKEAGRCLVSAATRNGMTLICTVLNCTDTYGRSQTLLSDGFSAYEYTKILSKDTAIEGEIANKKYALHVDKDLYYPILQEESAYLERKVEIFATRKPKKGDLVGKIQIYLLNRLLFSENLYKL